MCTNRVYIQKTNQQFKKLRYIYYFFSFLSGKINDLLHLFSLSICWFFLKLIIYEAFVCDIGCAHNWVVEHCFSRCISLFFRTLTRIYCGVECRFANYIYLKFMKIKTYFERKHQELEVPKLDHLVVVELQLRQPVPMQLQNATCRSKPVEQKNNDF